MPYRRRILRYGSDPLDLQGSLADDAIAGCWFELHRQGGCGAGEVQLRSDFSDRNVVGVGAWIACEFDDGERWYLGRVQSRAADSPSGVTLHLEGMAVELGEVFPGGFGITADGVKPHRFGVGAGFSGDPDYAEESVDIVSRPEDLVRKLMAQYVAGVTHITVESDRIEDQSHAVTLESAKFHGEESVRSILKEVGLRAGNVPWGVDEAGQFFFLKPRTTLAATWREGREPVRLRETVDHGQLYNRVLLTGGYIYGWQAESGIRRNFRWRGNYVQPGSRATYGERRIRLWTPWIRTAADSRAFAQAFFATYAAPSRNYELEIPDRDTLLRPWEGVVRLEDRHGDELLTAAVTTVRVQFDHRPRFRLQLGVEDPHTHWPEPPHDERWPEGSTAVSGWGGGDVPLPGGGGEDPGGGGGTSDDPAETETTGVPSSGLLTSDELTSDDVVSSDDESSHHSDATSEGGATGSVPDTTTATQSGSDDDSEGGNPSGSGNPGGGGSSDDTDPTGSDPDGSSSGPPLSGGNGTDSDDPPGSSTPTDDPGSDSGSSGSESGSGSSS